MKRLLTKTWQEFGEDEAMMRAAALAFYSLLSLIPLLSLVLLIIGLFIQSRTAEGYILGFVGDIVGANVADVLRKVFQTSEAYGSRATTVIGIIVLVIGGTAMIGHLQKGLNEMFDVVKPEMDTRRKIKAWFVSKGKYLVMIIVVAAAIVGLLIGSFFLSALVRLAGANVWVYRILDYVLLFGVGYLVMVFLFLYVPDKKLRYKQVGLGALLTMVFLIVGEILIGIFFRYSDKQKVYGFMAGIVLFVLWIYYSAIVFYFGAELTQVLAERQTGQTSHADPGSEKWGHA